MPPPVPAGSEASPNSEGWWRPELHHRLARRGRLPAAKSEQKACAAHQHVQGRVGQDGAAGQRLARSGGSVPHPPHLSRTLTSTSRGVSGRIVRQGRNSLASAAPPRPPTSPPSFRAAPPPGRPTPPPPGARRRLALSAPRLEAPSSAAAAVPSEAAAPAAPRLAALCAGGGSRRPAEGWECMARACGPPASPPCTACVRQDLSLSRTWSESKAIDSCRRKEQQSTKPNHHAPEVSPGRRARTRGGDVPPRPPPPPRAAPRRPRRCSCGGARGGSPSSRVSAWRRRCRARRRTTPCRSPRPLTERRRHHRQPGPAHV